MTQIKRIRKVLFTTAAFLIIAALFLQGCSSPSKMISDTTETAPGEAENTDDAKAVRKTEESGGDTGESEAAHTQDAAEQDRISPARQELKQKQTPEQMTRRPLKEGICPL